MKIYTRTGDHGETGLLGGVRVAKDHLVIGACGDLDETNSQLGLAQSFGLPDEVGRPMDEIQQDLFVLGSQLAECLSSKSNRAAKLRDGRVDELETLIDQLQVHLPPMDAFILPGGITPAAQLHVARTICRRAERSVVQLLQQPESSDQVKNCVIYLNRLSDLLFVMARYVNHVHGTSETKWLPGQS